MATRKPRYIRASEIGAYVYCRRAWWLRQVAGFEPEGKDVVWAAGEAAHMQHGQNVRRTQSQHRITRLLLLCGLVLVVAALLSLVFVH